MQPHSTELVLLIDGNNLAHFLYTNLAPGQKMTPEDAGRLIDHLSSYARQYGPRVSLECCLDRPTQVAAPQPENLRVLAVRYPKTADELLLDRFWFHHHSRRPCLVITNDQVILDEVREAGGATMLVSTFVRRPGLNKPVLRDPEDLPPVPVPPAETELPALPVSQAPAEHSAGQARPAPAPVPPAAPAPLDAAAPKPPASPLDLAASKPTQPDEPRYSLNLAGWPPPEGIRFLLDSFCPRHQPEITELFASLDTADFTSADLLELAQLLLDTCSSEPDFVTRGGSLMDRVRLALLQAPGDDLSLTELAERAQLKRDGLRGRIKTKAFPWVLVRQP